MDEIKSILNQANKNRKKPPAYQWQDLALRVIKDLNIPNFKRSAVFKACKEESSARILQALTDTEELCQGEHKWAYFFKVLSNKNKDVKNNTTSQ